MIRTVSPTTNTPIPSFSYKTSTSNFKLELSIASPNGARSISAQRFSPRLNSTEYTPSYCDTIKGIYFSVGGALLEVELATSFLRLREIEALKDNWNGNGAPSFSHSQVETLRGIVKQLSKQPFISPTAKGSIQFEYEDEEGNYLEFELFPDNRIKLFSFSKDGVANTKYIAVEKVSEIVRDFYRSTH